MEIKASRQELSTWEIQKVNGERVAGYDVQIIVSNYNIEKDVNYFNGFAMEKEAADKVIAAINGREAFIRQGLAAKVEQAYTSHLYAQGNASWELFKNKVIDILAGKE